MPEISNFYGIQVYINFREHNLPHFHAKYAEFKIIVRLGSCNGSKTPSKN